MNTLNPTPIENLPEDILLTVFTLLADKSRQSFHTILSISHVCSYWRFLALSTPELWRRYALLTKKNGNREGCYKFNADPMGDRDFGPNQLMLRCKDTPLDVGWECTLRGHKRLHYFVIFKELQQLSRMRSYQFELATHPKKQRFTDNINGRQYYRTPQELTAPHLEDLTIVSNCPDFSLTIQNKTFSTHLPSLKSLALYKVWIDITKFNLGLTLTKLACHFPNHWRSRGVYRWVPSLIYEWLDILKTLPNLRHLRLILSYLPHCSRPPGQTSISLNNITQMTLDLGGLDKLEAFLDNVSTPQCGKLRISFDLRTGQSLKRLMEKIVQRYVTPSTTQGNRLYIGLPNNDKIEVRFSPLDLWGALDDSTVEAVMLTIRLVPHYGRIASLTNRPIILNEIMASGWITHIARHLTSLWYRISLNPFPGSCDAVIQDLIEHAPALTTLVCPRASVERTMGQTAVREVEDGRFIADRRPVGSTLQIIPYESRRRVSQLRG